MKDQKKALANLEFLEAKLKRQGTKFLIDNEPTIADIQLFNQYKSFNYEKPTMTYDKKSGDVEIFDPMEEKRNKQSIIKSVDEAYTE